MWYSPPPSRAATPAARNPNRATTMQILAFCVYFAVVLAIGIYFFAKSKGGGEKEYFLGGRQMGPWVSAMSAQASDMSGWLLMGFPGSQLGEEETTRTASASKSSRTLRNT